MCGHLDEARHVLFISWYNMPFFSRKDHRRHCVTLAARRMPSPHTGENIRELVDKVLHEWDIHPSKVLATITDNGSNMLAAFRSETSNSGDDNDSSVEEDETLPDVPAQVLDFTTKWLS